MVRTTWGVLMRKLLLLIMIGICCVLGCSDPPPINEAKKIEQPQIVAPEVKTPAKPLQSDVAAAQVLKDVLNAHTNNKPDLLAKLKSCYVVRTGLLEQPTGRTRNVWKIHQAWPDRYRVTTEIHSTSISSITFARGPSGAWQYPGGPEKLEKAPLANDILSTLNYQQKEDALSLLFGLAEPGAIVTMGSNELLDGVELLTLQVWNAGTDYAQLGIDKKTKLLKRIIYSGREFTTVIVKELIFTAYENYEGIKLGSKMIVKAGGRTLAEWNELTVEMGKTYDNKLFENP